VLVTANTALTVSDSVNAVLIRGNNITISGAAGNTLTVGSGTTQSGTLASSGTGNTVSVPILALARPKAYSSAIRTPPRPRRSAAPSPAAAASPAPAAAAWR